MNTPPLPFLKSAQSILNAPLSEEVQAGFARYEKELLHWNKQYNLVGRGAVADIWNRHFLDSLSLAPLIDTETTLLDIGSGAGFPGLPLALTRPDIKVMLAESVQKKATFLTRMIALLGLKERVQIHADRAEKIPSATRFHAVTARAVGEISLLLEMAAPLLDAGGRALLLKGERHREELAEYRMEKSHPEFSDGAIHHLSDSHKAILVFTKTVSRETA